MDLQKLMDHLATMPFVDMNKAVLVGGSYAGYMISWCFGHDIIKKVHNLYPHRGNRYNMNN